MRINKRSNIILRTLLVLIGLSAMVIICCLFIAQRFRTNNLEKSHLLKMKKVGDSIDIYWMSKRDIVDRVVNDKYIKKAVGDSKRDDFMLNSILNVYKAVSNASIVYVMDLEGNVVGSSNVGDTQNNILGNNYAFRPYFTNALRGETVIYPALGVTTMERGLYLSKSIYSEDRKEYIGVAVVKLALDHIDAALKSDSFIASMVSPDGIVFSSTKDDWLYHSVNKIDSSVLRRLRKTKQFADVQPKILEYDIGGTQAIIDQKEYRVLKYSLLMDGWELIFCGSLNVSFGLEKTQKAMIIMIAIFLTLMTLAFALLVYILLKDRKQRDQISKNWEESELMVKNREEELKDINKILEEELEERRVVELDLEKKMNELERFNKVAIEREVRIIELKKEVNSLCRQLKRSDRYKSDYDLERKNF